MNGNAIAIKNKQLLKSFYAYLTPSISQALFIIILLVLSLYKGNSLLNDLDIGWHIRVGEHILDTLTIPGADMYSFITPTRSWLAHEWLSEVIMGSIHKYYGLTGLVIFFSFLIAVIYSSLFKMLQAKTRNIFLNILIILIVITSSMGHWLARPHIFSLGLTLIFYYILSAFDQKQKNYLYVLPVMTVLWVNLHGGFIIGPMIVIVYLAAALIDIYSSHVVDKGPTIEKAKKLALIAVLCLLCTLINPYGYHSLIYPFQVVSGKLYTDNIVEFLSPDFHKIGFLPFEIFILALITTFAITKRRLSVLELGLVVLFVHMSLVSVRYIPLLGIIAAPILAEHASSIPDGADNRIVKHLKKKAEGFAEIDESVKGHLLIIGTVVVVLLMTINGKLAFSFNKEKAPVDAVEFLKKEHVPGHMFNQEIFGEYTIYAAHDKYKIFMDDRFDMYGDEQFKDYMRAAAIGQGWEKVFDKYDINWIFFSTDSPLSRVLLISKDWHLIYSDKTANIFVRNIPANQYLISKYSDVKPAAIEKKDKEFIR